jgi:hypothetical protein
MTQAYILGGLLLWLAVASLIRLFKKRGMNADQ